MGLSNGETAASRSSKSLSELSGSVSYSSTESPEPIQMMSKKRRYITVTVLFLVNLLNYMDRYTIAAVLTDVQAYFHIGDGEAGLLQAMFVVGFSLTAPAFGYFGDRYNRKWLMLIGIGLWSLVTLSGSFVPGDMFWLFVILRGVVGIGEASYVTIAPTLISDMFIGKERSTMLMVFYFAIPVGSGLGYITGANLAKAFDDWRFALRLTPGLGVVCCLLIAFVTQEPPRGMAEDGASHESKSTVKEDLIALAKNKTFVFSTLGNTCVTFVSGALALFAPKFMFYAYRVSGDFVIESDEVALYMGIITTAAGFVGVALGTTVARWVKEKHKNGDGIVCAVGILACTPFLFGTVVLCEFTLIPAWICVFIGEVLLFMNWPLVGDMLLYTVSATRRSTAEAVQLFVCHILGDAASPYILGETSDALRAGRVKEYYAFQSLQYSLFVTLFVTVLGGGFFLFCSLYIVKDKAEAEAATKGIEPPAQKPSNIELELKA